MKTIVFTTQPFNHALLPLDTRCQSDGTLRMGFCGRSPLRFILKSEPHRIVRPTLLFDLA